MTRETRIALLVGLVFIVLFGLVLGQRSLSVSDSSDPTQPAVSGVRPAPPSPGPEMLAGPLYERERRAALSPSNPPGGSPAPPAGGHDESNRTGQPAPAAPVSHDRNRDAPPAPRTSRPNLPLRTYRVQSGDTLIRIARKVYGRGRENEHLRIYRANRSKLTDPATLSIGQVLVIPALPTSRPPRPRVASGATERRHYTEMTLEAVAERFGQTYVVRPGDCLTGIARRTMGSGGRAAVKRLLKANRDRIENPDRLPIGLKLNIPR